MITVDVTILIDLLKDEDIDLALVYDLLAIIALISQRIILRRFFPSSKRLQLLNDVLLS